MKKNVYAVFSKYENHDTRPYSSICEVGVELYGLCLAEGVAQMVKEVRENGCESQVVKLPLGSLLGEDLTSAYLEETILHSTYGHWE